MIRAAILAMVLAAGAPVPAGPAPAPVVEQWSTANDPAVSGRCMGKPIPPVERPLIPDTVENEGEYLTLYYQTYARTYCELMAEAVTEWA